PPLPEETDLRRIVDSAVLEEANDHGAGGLELVHVLEDENLHLLRPRRNVRVRGVLLHGPGVAQRKRQVVEAMLREQRGVREPWPSTVRVLEKRAIHILQHLTAARGIGRLGIDPCRGKKRVVAPW